MSHFMKRRTFMKTVGKATAAIFLPPLFSSCQTTKKQTPNILWIAVEDISPLMSCYGYDVCPISHLLGLGRNTSS